MSGFVPLRSHAGSVASVVTDALGPDGVTPRGSPQAAAAAPSAMIAPPTNHCRMPSLLVRDAETRTRLRLGVPEGKRQTTAAVGTNALRRLCLRDASGPGVRSPRKPTAT